MKRLVTPALVALAAGLVLAGGTQASSTSVIRTTLASSWNDFPMTCLETQLISGAKRTETFTCQYPGPISVPERDNETNAGWFSDFDGAPAKHFSIVILPSGLFTGTATY
jgi:hypothetical protein